MAFKSEPGKAGSAQEAYQQKAMKERQQFLDRARHNALLTVPSLMPPEGHDGKQHLLDPYQGLGAAGSMHLSSRLNTALLPAGRPHMRFNVPPAIRMENDGKVPEELEVGLALAEQLVQQEVEDKGWRPSTLMALQQDIVCGNHLEHQLEDNFLRIFRLDQYIVRRDYAGRVLEVILEECLTADTLPPGMTVTGRDGYDEVKLYTWIRRDREILEVHQEIDDGTKVSDTVRYTDEDLPYNPVRWSWTPGEDYGRAFVEEHSSDLRALDSLTKAELEMAAMASRNFIAVRPGAASATVKRRLTQAINGDIMMIDPDMVDLKSFDNPSGFQLVNAKTQQLVDQISRAFLLQSVGQRDAERVTATEIERDIQELEAALGGNFSNLNNEMMEKRTRMLVRNMMRDGKLPPEITEIATPTVLTGLEAVS
ncbi:MAG: hypothetical protein GWN58_52895, partial [Anaerolineae bacterium]|nr:hypothetical protein [Anaerolineae bacterium]